MIALFKDELIEIKTIEDLLNLKKEKDYTIQITDCRELQANCDVVINIVKGNNCG